MISRGLTRLLLCLVLGGGLLLAGCNILDDLGPPPRTVEALLADARLALRAGDSARAVALLERALEKDSTDMRVRVELGNALYTERGLDVFVLRDAGEHLTGTSDSSASEEGSFGSPVESSECTNGVKPDMASGRYVRVGLDAAPIRQLVDHRAVVERVRDLVVNGVMARRSRELAKAPLRLRRKARLVAAATYLVSAVVRLHESFSSTESTLYLDPGASSSPALVACAQNGSALDRAHTALCQVSDAAEQSGVWLRERAQLSGSERKSILVERLETLADMARRRTGCSKVTVGGFRSMRLERANRRFWSRSPVGSPARHTHRLCPLAQV